MNNSVNNESKAELYKKPNQLSVLYYLVKRHFKVFWKNHTLVLFSLMVPLVVLVVYVIFLRPMEVSQLDAAIKEGLGFEFDPENATKEALELVHKIRGIADEWMIAGVLSVSCITIALNTENVMVTDKEMGITKDFASSPISGSTVTVSYAVFNAVVTFLANFIVYLICLIYLAAYGAILPDFIDGCAIVGVMLLSTISATLLVHFICSFVNSVSVLSSVTAIFSAAIGFLCGAYLPASMMPRYVQYLTMFFPGSYSSGLFRNYFMRKPLVELYQTLIDVSNSGSGLITKSEQEITAFIKGVEGDFSLELDFFGHKVPVSVMALVVLAFIAIFIILDLFFTPQAFKKYFSRKSKLTKRLNKKNKDFVPTSELPVELVTDNSDKTRSEVSDDVKNVPANKDNFPFDGDEKNISSSGHIIDKDE